MSDHDSGVSRPARPLADLLDYLARQAPHKYADKRPGTASPGELPEVDYFQKTWSRLSTGLRLQQAQKQVPENAGPLNSTHLIHRSLALMQARSPVYLEHFLGYVEALSWLDALSAEVAPQQAKPKPATRTPAARKSPRKTR